VSFWRKSIAAAKLAVLTHLEYRLNFFIDGYFQPAITTMVEIALWYGIWHQGGFDSLNGFGLDSYLSYALWATFVARVTANWQYEFMMMEDVVSGKLNAILLRPFSFYSFYLSQFLGYKITVLAGTISVPLVASVFFGLPAHLERLPLVFLLLIFYLLFVHTLSFFLACFSFYMTRAHSLTVGKNIVLWVLAGELFPLDLIPEPFAKWAILSPFSSGAYIPVAYITGRIEVHAVYQAFLSISVSLVVISIFAALIWSQGVKRYSGTGA
jgi:ABC-2 type transport system permease protein